MRVLQTLALPLGDAAETANNVLELNYTKFCLLLTDLGESKLRFERTSWK